MSVMPTLSLLCAFGAQSSCFCPATLTELDLESFRLVLGPRSPPRSIMAGVGSTLRMHTLGAGFDAGQHASRRETTGGVEVWSDIEARRD